MDSVRSILTVLVVVIGGITLSHSQAMGSDGTTRSSLDSSEYDPPAGYYDNAVGQGSLLNSQLSQIITSGHVQQTYGAFRYNSIRYDADPNNSGKILLIYNRASVSGSWDSGNTWNREHIWPQSRQPGSASNGTSGNLGDAHALRPANPSINSTRGNMPFGTYDATGSYRRIGSYYFPGDQDKGDVARSLFYSATRYMSTLSLVNGYPSGYAMGDLNALLRWHYTDVPDTFERRRNHVVYGDQHNRNPYVDRPEFVWSVFGGGANDSTLYVSEAIPSDGSSVKTIVFPSIIEGGVLPGATSVELDKAGNDPTYYEVLVTGDASSSSAGRYNAFDFGTQQEAISVELDSSLSLPGEYSGTVTIDNLDVSSEGAGKGSQDGNDVIQVSFAILDHSEASFSQTADEDTLLIDFGAIPAGSTSSDEAFVLANLVSESAPTADLEIVSISATGDEDVLEINLSSGSTVSAGQVLDGVATFDPTGLPVGDYSALYSIAVADESLPGGTSGTSLTLTLVAEITESVVYFDYNGDGIVDESDSAHFLGCIAGPGQGYPAPECVIHDPDEDGDVDLLDASAFLAAFSVVE